MAFDSSIRQVLNHVRATDLSILIWGPGAGGGEHFEKRQKFKAQIEQKFPNAEVRFSEDPKFEALVPGNEFRTVPEREAWHLAACDLCIVLDTSKGAGEEVAHFTGSTHAYKLLIFTDEKYRDANSFPAELRKYANQMFYTTTEYVSCSLVEKVLARIEQKALGNIMGIRT